MENIKKRKIFEKIMFKMFSCPFFILLLLVVGNFLIFEGKYGYIGYQILLLIVLMIYWIRSVDKNYKFKLMITKYDK